MQASQSVEASTAIPSGFPIIIPHTNEASMITVITMNDNSFFRSIFRIFSKFNFYFCFSLQSLQFLAQEIHQEASEFHF